MSAIKQGRNGDQEQHNAEQLGGQSLVTRAIATSTLQQTVA